MMSLLVPTEESAIEVVPAEPLDVVLSSVDVHRRAGPRTIASLNFERPKVVPSLPADRRQFNEIKCPSLTTR